MLLPLPLLLAACTPALTCGPGTREIAGVCTPPPTDTDPDTDTDTAEEEEQEEEEEEEEEVLLRDDFDLIDPSRWSYGTWRLGITQLSSEQVTASSSGELTLSHVPGEGEGEWLGGELYTAANFGHSTWTFRLSAPAQTGTVCAVFLYGAVVVGDTWITNEIDVELVGGQVWFSTYSQWRPEDDYGDGPTHRSVVWASPAGFDVSAWHEYTIDYAEDGVTFWVDGQPAAAITDAVPLGRMGLHINHWTSDTWQAVGTPPAGEVLTCRVDWIEGRRSLR